MDRETLERRVLHPYSDVQLGAGVIADMRKLVEEIGTTADELNTLLLNLGYESPPDGNSLPDLYDVIARAQAISDFLSAPTNPTNLIPFNHHD